MEKDEREIYEIVKKYTKSNMHCKNYFKHRLNVLKNFKATYHAIIKFTLLKKV